MPVEPLRTQDDDLLTAYLDNELPSADMERLRTRLAQDADLRKRLAEMQRAWDLLDDLPDSLADHAFTRSTLELVTASIVSGDDKMQRLATASAWKGLIRFWPVGVVFALAISGLILGFAFRKYVERSQLRNLELVANYQGLKVVSELSKGKLDIQKLVDEVTSIPDWQRLGDAVHKGRMLPSVPKELGKRKDWFTNLSTEQQAMIWRNDRDFNRLERADFKKIYQINQQLSATKDLTTTNRVLGVLAAVVESMPDDERAIFESLPESEKLQRVHELCCLSLTNWYAEQFESTNPDEMVQQEYHSILSWVESLPPVVRDRLSANIFFRRVPFLFEESLIENLSTAPRSWFLALKDKERESMAVRWVFAILRSETFGRFPESKLFEAYSEKDASVRESLDLMPPNELNNQLSRELSRPRRAQNNQGDRRIPRGGN